MSTGELRVGPLKDFKDGPRVRYTTAHATAHAAGGGQGVGEFTGSNKQPSPILKGQKSCKGFIGTIKKT